MEITQGITIDNNWYWCPISKLKRKADFLDKYANRTEDGDLKRELIGVYKNYEIEFGEFPDTADGRKKYNALFDKLSEAEEFHTITIPDASGTYTFKAYISSVSDEYKRIYSDGYSTFKGLSCKFTAKAPAAT